MNDADLRVRRTTYTLLVELGRAPSAVEIAERLSSSTKDVARAWQRLHDAHALVLDADTGTLRMLSPFSAVPTLHRVAAAGRRWYANCAWDALGVCAALRVDGLVETSCPDCGDALTLEVRDAEPSDRSLVFHCLVPARHWWDDIAFT